MEAPLFSTFSAISELFVTAGVLYVVWSNFKGRGYPWKLALGVILFEFSVNMMYMIHRMNQETDPSVIGEKSGAMIAFMAAHGSLSLLVFIMLVVLCSLAFVDFRKNKFFFQNHPKLTYVFVALWMVSVLSGEALYVVKYIL